MRGAVAVRREIQAEGDGAAPGPEKMRICGAPLVEEAFARRKHAVGDPEYIVQLLGGQPFDAFLGSGGVAELLPAS